ncbi:GNAT family N-acetyltransferase [Chitinimonas sp. BJYL2]|uniref:GNAT family N-acetyltransferase n=1 Tax=Chitinimonas sp. BJYL2 TaxID=2976696 RepID=UPI0022B2B083|nr:GNAT family N-acetyltransferase [Chitinimonas sp. BJYL2]
METVVRFHSGMQELDPVQWDALAGPQPFVCHAYLSALEATGCIGPGTGWQPLHASLSGPGGLLAVMPLYLKQHSWGEYVFDWAWAQAAERAGIPYYPKLLSAVPFTPVGGSRLLARSRDHASHLLGAVLDKARESGYSGLHCLFPPDGDTATFAAHGMMQRHGVQFHWHNRGYRSFDDFLAALNHDKRKKLRQARRKVVEAGVMVERKVGGAISDADWAFFTRCYEQTYLQHRSSPYLTPQFFTRLGEVLGEHCLLILAYRDGAPIAAALNLFDAERLYGRYWGAMDFVPNLHFELCYHQGIEFAIERGLQVFEGGAQGEHKLARGLEAVPTRSWHWIAHTALADAVNRFLVREGQGVAHYLDELDERAPFRSEPP